MRTPFSDSGRERSTTTTRPSNAVGLDIGEVRGERFAFATSGLLTLRT
jgi:hypothetical protein